MSRPLGKPQPIGTNAGVSTRPNDAVMAAGLFVPGAGAPSQYVNHKDGDHAQRLRDVDTLEIRNWRALINSVHAGPSPGGGAPTLVKGMGCKLWHDERPLLFAADDEELMISYDGGRSWAADYTAAGNIEAIAQSPIANIVGFLNAGAGTVARTSLGSAWGAQALASCTAIKSVDWDPYANEFVVTGTHSGTFGIWKAPVVSGALTFTAFDTGNVAVSDGHFAASEDWKLAASDTTLHRWAPGVFTPVSTLGPQGGGVNITELRWIPGPDMFMLVAHAGGACEIWVSADGASWTQRTSSLPVAVTFNGVLAHSSAVRGSIFAMCGTMAGRYGILWTGDAGESWSWEPDPTALGGATPTSGVAMVGIGDRQWLAASYDGTGNFDLAFGMRMGD